MESLGQRQRRFVRLVGQLIEFAYAQGYELTLGDGYRDPRVFGIAGETRGYGHPYSNHKLRLAVDLNLFRDGRYLNQGEAHAPLHDFWDSIGGAARIENDMNHYALEWEGRR